MALPEHKEHMVTKPQGIGAKLLEWHNENVEEKDAL